MPKILFVCTANRCRSPMAEALFRSLLDPSEASSWQSGSAGTWTTDGLPAMHKAVSVMIERGLDLSPHRSRSIRTDLLNEQNLILVMESGHKEGLSAEFPRVANRIRLLSEIAGPPFDIQDPVSEPIDAYRATARLLHALLCDAMPTLRILVSQLSSNG